MATPAISTDAGGRASPGPLTPAAIAGLLLCTLAFWMLQHPYEGIVHDSLLYALSALARLHPDSLGHDIFLTVGSQDRYTLFSPIAAAAIRHLGLESAGSLLTFISELGFFFGGWVLARHLLPRSVALLCMAALVMLPSGYGAKHVFSYVEPFMTPRLPAEALVLAALAATVRGRHAVSATLLLAAALLHPLMAAAGIVMLLVLHVGLPRPRLALATALGAFALLALAAWLTPFGPVSRFSDGWFNLLYTRGTYLFPSLWPAEDWTHTCVPLAALIIGAMTTTDPALRRICLAALITAVGGLVLAVVGSDVLRIVIIAQGQPWRWLWLSNALAALLTPLVLMNCWQRDGASRAAAVLLAAAWVVIDEFYAPAVALAAILLALNAYRITNPRAIRLMLFSSWAILALGILVLAGFVLGVQRQVAALPADPKVFDSHYLLGLRYWKPWISGGVFPFGAFLGLWRLVIRGRHEPWRPLIAIAAGVVLCCAFAPFAWKSWTREDYTEELQARFSPWRTQIPVQAQVLWFDNAFATWYLLERPSYWSATQNAASVFSEEMARKIALREMIIMGQDITRDGPRDLATLCERNSLLDFFVTAADMGPTPFPPIVFDSRSGTSTIHLYSCNGRRKT